MATASALSRGAKPTAEMTRAQLLATATMVIGITAINADAMKLRAWDGVMASSLAKHTQRLRRSADPRSFVASVQQFYSRAMPPPNGSRLSCGAESERSQMETYHHGVRGHIGTRWGRAPAAS